MANTPCYETIELTKPTNTLQLSRKVSKGRISVYLIHEDREVIRPLKVRGFSGNEIILSETIDPESVEHKYMRECVGNYLDPLGKIMREKIFVEVFYEVWLTILRKPLIMQLQVQEWKALILQMSSLKALQT